MIEFKSTPQAVGGVRWSTAAAGIKNSAPASSSPDVALMEIAAGSNVAGVFTLNAFVPLQGNKNLSQGGRLQNIFLK